MDGLSRHDELGKPHPLYIPLKAVGSDVNAADSFSRLLYSFPNLGVIVEVKARLGVCYQNLGDYNRALKFYNQALSDSTETPFLSKTHIRFNIALSSENAGDLSKAEEEYKKIIAEVNL
ncbi:tetratricopeptide repeat protein [Necator americanus]|uniref:Tetratricopeptide repeat protein n=1 Tax=Necator americanus TaxID=51031 RepID=W2SXT2_NECAM|nr:tetratricopeptide repeat protein [Necator americanus]ETN74574.1 tetratricopeptide repeat protein [Necator americanus]